MYIYRTYFAQTLIQKELQICATNSICWNNDKGLNLEEKIMDVVIDPSSDPR